MKNCSQGCLGIYSGGGEVGALKIERYMSNEKPRFKKSEMRWDLPFKKGTVVSASEIK